MNSPPSSSASPDALVQLLQLESELLKTDSMESFSFLLVNQLRRLIAYQQATLWIDRSGSLRAVRGSDVNRLDPNAPYLQWLSRVVRHAAQNHPEQSVVLERSSLPPSIAQEWDQYRQDEVLLVPLWNGKQQLKGMLTLSSPTAWGKDEKAIIDRFSTAAGVVLESHLHQQRWKSKLAEWGASQPIRKLVMIALIVALFVVPVRLSSLAPAEIVAMNPMTMTAPMDGVVERVLVRPNQWVEEGDAVILLDEKSLQSQLLVEQKGAEVVKAELLNASQKAFEGQGGEEVQMLRSRLRQHQARVDWVQQQLQQVVIRAPMSGVVVNSETQSWKGRPVRTGEKIITLADPSQIEAELWLPVEDLLPPSEEKEVELYLYRRGSESIAAELIRTGYRAELSPQGVLSYRVVASVHSIGENETEQYRIGERGSARVYGPERSLFFYLFRKPIFWIRSWIG